MTTQIKITQLVDIGANLATTTVLPVVNMSGVPTTQKTNLGNVGNTILQGAGTTWKPAALANLAYSVANADQPNITSLGTLTELTVDGNVNLGDISTLSIGGGSDGYVLQTNGEGALTWTAQTGGSYGNANVANYLPTYTGNVGANWVIATYFSGNGHNLTFLPGANVQGAVTFATTANAVAAANVTGLGNIATINLTGSTSNVLYGNGVFAPVSGGSGNTGNVTFDDNIVIGTGDSYGGSGLYLAEGPDSIANAQYLRVRAGDYPTHIHFDTGNNDAYDQYFGDDNKYLKLELGSTGNVVIGTYNGDGYERWTFDRTGNLTVPGNIQSITTGFAFTSNITGITAGATVIVGIADGVFGGPLTGQVTISSVVGMTEANGTWYFEATEANEFQLYYDEALDYPVDGTGWNSYVSGGLAVSAGYSDLNITGGNVSITNNNGNTWVLDDSGNLVLPRGGIVTETNIPFGGLSGNTISLKPSGGLYDGQELLIYPTAGGDFNHLHLTSGNLYSTELFLGNDDLYVKLANTGNIVINSNDGSGNIGTWTLDTTGNLTLPTISLGEGVDEQTIIQSQRKVIPPYRYSVAIDGSAPTEVYVAASGSLTLKSTIVVQHQGLGLEMFDVSAVGDGANVIYAVSNRLNATGQPDTTAVVDWSGGGGLAITLTVNSGATTSWVTYDTTEFGIAVD